MSYLPINNRTILRLLCALAFSAPGLIAFAQTPKWGSGDTPPAPSANPNRAAKPNQRLVAPTRVLAKCHPRYQQVIDYLDPTVQTSLPPSIQARAFRQSGNYTFLSSQYARMSNGAEWVSCSYKDDITHNPSISPYFFVCTNAKQKAADAWECDG